MSKVKVSKKDILRVITEADQHTRWGTSAWKARERLLAATVGGTETSRDLLDYLNDYVVYTKADAIFCEGVLAAMAECGDYPAPCNCDDPRKHNGH